MNQGGLSREKDLFRQALCEGLARKYQAELAECPDGVSCSEALTHRMKGIMEAHAVSERKRKLRGRLTALLVAAALLVLSACTVYAYRGMIQKLLVEECGWSLRLFYPESRPFTDVGMAEYYTLGYVPQGYELVKSHQETVVNSMLWKNEEGSVLIWEQMYCYGAMYTLDAEKGESRILKSENGEREIYCRTSEAHTYIWNDGTYSFSLTASEPLSDAELNRILDGIETIPQDAP